MQKPAPLDFPVHDLIRDRWSSRAFANKPVEPAVLTSLLEAARWAPSSNNEQPWAYLVATKNDAEAYAKTLSVLVEFNASWAKDAPVLILAVAGLKFHANGTPNRNAFYDTGAATALLTVEAKERGLRPVRRRPRRARRYGRDGGQTSVRNSRGLGAHCSHRRRLSGRSQFAPPKAARS